MTNTATVSAPESNPVIRWFAPVWDVLTWKRSAYLLTSFPLGIFWLIFTIFMVSTGAAMLLLWVGVLVFAAAFVGWRLGARLERQLAIHLAEVNIDTPYRRTAPNLGLLGRTKLWLSDPATWRDVLFLSLLFPLGVLWFVLQVILLSLPAALITSLFVYRSFHLQPQIGGFGGFPAITIDTFPEALLAALIGILILPISARIIRAAGFGHALLAQSLLGPTASSVARAEVESLRVSREKGIDTAEADRQRIERDLHDGAQQRLVAVAMQLGRIKEKLDEQHDARELADEAHDQAKLALAELRDLARGIHPAVLTDRGLDAAISALAARSPVPVTVRVDLDHRPKSSIESTAYFVVSEALTNVGKHASAQQATVAVKRDGDTLIVAIEDDGVGGAVATGQGLAGLADRVAAVGGTLEVNSPNGGPTIIRAEMPCES